MRRADPAFVLRLVDVPNTPARSSDGLPESDPASRPLPVAAVFLGLGIAAGDALEPAFRGSATVNLVATLLLSILGAAIVWKALARNRRAWPGFLVAFAFLLCGVARIVALPRPATNAAGYASLTGVVVRGTMDLPAVARRNESTTSLLLDAVTIETGTDRRELSGRIKLEIRSDPTFVPRGATVSAMVRLRSARLARNPGNRGEAWRFSRSGIVAAAVVEDATALSVREGTDPLSRILAANDRLRRELTHGVFAALEPTAAGLAAALVLGVRDGLDAEFTDAVAGAGTIHLLAISGMQVAWLVVVVRGLLGLFLRPTACYVVVVVFALGYADLAGAEAPVLRAGVGAALIAIGRYLGRPARPLDALAVAAIVLLLDEPGELFRAGFQLSFVACYALLTRIPASPPRAGAIRRLIFSVLESGRWSLRATVATAPIVACHFGTIAPLSPLLTLVLTPPFLAAFLASALVMPLTLVLPDQGIAIAAAPAETCLRFAAWAFETTARWPFASISSLPVDRTGALVALLGLEIARRTGLGGRERAAAICGALVLAAAIEIARCRAPRRTQVTVLDVGHGQAVIVRSPSGADLLFDCGTSGAASARDGSRAAAITLDACGALGIRSFDAAFLSHGDADHRNGLERLVERGFVARLVVAAGLESRVASRLLTIAARSRVPIDFAERGFTFRDPAGVLTVRALLPDAATHDLEENDRSLVLLLESAVGTSGRPVSDTEIEEGPRTRIPSVTTILLPGDLETDGIRRLLAIETDLRADVWILPHHGRDQPALAPFAFQVRAPLWVASRGPLHGASLAAILAARHEAKLLVTAESGAITLSFDPRGWIEARGFLPAPDGQRIDRTTPVRGSDRDR